MMTLKGLPSTYNKDLQEDKEPLFDTVDNISACLQITQGVLSTMGINPVKMREALTMDMLATDLADYLVRKGIPFRQTHHISGRAVALAETSKRPLSELSLQELQNLNPLFEEDVKDVFDFEQSVQKRGSIGGTSLEMIERQVRVLNEGVQPAN